MLTLVRPARTARIGGRLVAPFLALGVLSTLYVVFIAVGGVAWLLSRD